MEEQYRDFNQSQYLCTVRIYPPYPEAAEPLHWTHGLGVTIDMAVQEAAYQMLTIMRAHHGLLQNTEFCYVPATLGGEDGYLCAAYYGHSHEDPRLQVTDQL